MYLDCYNCVYVARSLLAILAGLDFHKLVLSELESKTNHYTAFEHSGYGL